MADVTFTIPNAKLQYFIEAYGHEWHEKLEDGNPTGLDKEGRTQAEFAKQKAFEQMAIHVREYHRAKSYNAIPIIDIQT